MPHSEVDGFVRTPKRSMTVKTHVGSLLGKSGARDRTALAIAAHEYGIVRSTDR